LLLFLDKNMIFTQKLIEKNIIDKKKAKELEESFKNFDGSEEKFLLTNKIVDEKTLNELKSDYFHMEFFLVLKPWRSRMKFCL